MPPISNHSLFSSEKKDIQTFTISGLHTICRLDLREYCALLNKTQVVPLVWLCKQESIATRQLVQCKNPVSTVKFNRINTSIIAFHLKIEMEVNKEDTMCKFSIFKKIQELLCIPHGITLYSSLLLYIKAYLFFCV